MLRRNQARLAGSNASKTEDRNVSADDGNRPERPTLVERMVDSFGLPYVAGAVLLTCLIGAPAVVLLHFLDTNNLPEAFRLSFTQLLNVSSGSISQGRGIANLILIDFVLPLYVILATRYMRTRVERSASRVVEMSLADEDAVRHAFGGFSSVLVPSAITAVMIAVLVIGHGGFLQFGPVTTVVDYLQLVVYVFAGATFIWVYAKALVGLFQLGRGELRLRGKIEDRIMQMRVFGSLSLSLALSFFASLAVLSVTVFLAPATAFLMLLVALVVLGVIMFFIPLSTSHQRMAAERRREKREVEDRVAELLEPSRSRRVASVSKSAQGDERAEQLMLSIASVNTLLFLRAKEKRLANLPTWPIDPSILQQLGAIVIPVVTILLATIIQEALNL